MRPARLSVLLVFAVVASVPASAQTEFNPSVSGETLYSDNLFYAESSTAVSDTAFAVDLDLPVSRQWRTGDLEFRYNPRLIRYQDTAELDRTDHFLGFSLRRDLSRTSNLAFVANASKTQAQLVTPDDPDALTERVDRDSYGVTLDYDRQIGQRWRWRASAGARGASNEVLAGVGTGTTVQDRDQLRFTTGFNRNVSANTSLGLELQFQKNRLDNSGDENVRTALFTVEHEIGARSSLDAGVGAFATDNEDQGLPDRSGFQVQLGYNRDYRRVSVRVSARHAPTSGGNLPGTSTNTNIGVTLTSLQTNSLFWNVSAVVTRREPADPDLPEVDTQGFFGDLTWLFHPKVGLRFTASSVRQSDDAPMGAEIDVLQALAGVVWYPKGHSGRIPG
jgi:hypothetical protein